MIPSLYIHIPFCKKKCNYCDFISYAGKEALIDDYIESLIREFESLLSTIDFRLSTIYFGGGTPTLLEPRHFDKIISTLVRHSSLGIRHFEIALESNPATADKTKLKALRQLGINRLSIGAQTFNDRHLKTLGRLHSATDIFRFFENARSAGFDNINLDLIFALPDQTFDEWKSDLQTALSLSPEHLSAYNLQIEEGTALWHRLNPHPLSLRERGIGGEGPLSLPSEETELAMYEYTIETLTTADYHHYEISNFARPGFECRHNINYWKNGNYIGLGAGAHSHVDSQRWANPDSIEEYLPGIRNWFKDMEASKQSSGVVMGARSSFYKPASSIPTSIHNHKQETIFLGLRLLDGLETEKFQGFENEAAELIEDGLLMRENNYYKLTRKGLYLGNLVFEKFV